MFRSVSLGWNDVDRFEVGEVKNKKMVMFNFSKYYLGSKTGAALAKQLAGYEGGIPDTYDKSAEELAALLND